MAAPPHVTDSRVESRLVAVETLFLGIRLHAVQWNVNSAAKRRKIIEFTDWSSFDSDGK
jgi:hypothetical protein